MIDIGNEGELRRYLGEKNVFADMDRVSVVYYPGGVSGIVALASDGGRDILVKQALPKLKVKDDWQCDPGRIITEHKAHEIYAGMIPDKVPLPLFADDENKVIGRVGAPDGTPMWKAQLLAGLLDFRVAFKAADALLVIHRESAGDERIAREFDDNAIFHDLRISPYIEKTISVHPDLADRARPVIDRLMGEKMVLVHGDYSPKNILVDGETIYILDYEVAHYGHPTFDLAFFFNHFMLKAVKNRQWAAAYLNMLLYMAEHYFGGVDFMDPALLERQTVELLGFMLIARVDGKSPAEYIADEDDKKTIRAAARALWSENAPTLAAAAGILAEKLQEHIA